MEKDFHFAVTYVVARLAGFVHDEALIVSTSAQYVDDTVSEGTIRFKTGQQFRRISSAHEKLNPKIALSSAERQVWVPFHFLPAADSKLVRLKSKFFSALVCRPNSQVAQAMLDDALKAQDSPVSLYRLGITAHVFVDTWAHQGFAGINSRVNRAWGIKLYNTEKPANRLVHLNQTIRAQGLGAYLSRCWYFILAKLLSRLFPMGHGAVLHYPDWPFLKWSYIGDDHNVVTRDNPKDFIDAADHLFKFFTRYRAGNGASASLTIPPSDRERLVQMLSTIKDEDGDKRCAQWIHAIAEGHFSFGPAKIAYHPKGPRSWKYQALKTDKVKDHFWERFDYSDAFTNSHWAKFHMALQAHQNAVLHEILPRFGLSVN